MAAAVPIAALALTAASTAYSVQQGQQARKKADQAKPNDPQQVLGPDLQSQQTNEANAQRQAQSAGGTITGPNQGGPGTGTFDSITSAPNAPRKTLLGT